MVGSIVVGVVDDHKLLAQMLARELLEREFDARVIDVCADVVEQLRAIDADVALVDAVMGSNEDAGLDLIGPCIALGITVVMLTGVNDEVRHAQFIAAGAKTVVHKGCGCDGVSTALADVIRGLDPLGANRRRELAELLRVHELRSIEQMAPLQSLTEREQVTLQGLVDGLTVDRIASDRTVAESTVRSQVRSILRKLGATSQVEAISIAGRSGMRPCEPNN